MKRSLAQFARVEFAPPRFLAMPTAGIDVSTSGIKLALLVERIHGLELEVYAEQPLPLGTIVSGDITDHNAVVTAVATLIKKHGIECAAIALPESKGYLFKAESEGDGVNAWRTSVEQKIDEYVPLPPSEVVFDVIPVGEKETLTQLVGVGYARRVVDEFLGVFDDAHITVRAIESENFALPRALLPRGSTETVLIIDIGKTTTKLLFVASCVPHFATTLDVGGHALTLAVQKHFGVTEEEAKKVKAEHGIVSGTENDEYLSTMLSTVSVIREEISRRLDYWQTHAAAGEHNPVTRVILVGGNATVRGLPEYLETAFHMPVSLGDVFINLASRDDWVPSIEYMESLAYGTAIGLALREYAS